MIRHLSRQGKLPYFRQVKGTAAAAVGAAAAAGFQSLQVAFAMIKAAVALLALAMMGFAADDSSFVVEVYRNYYVFKKHACNGALIDPNWVLVPASCLAYDFYGNYQIVVGSESFKSYWRFKHEGYDNKLSHDIGLMRLSSKATFEATGARPINIPPDNVFHPGPATLYTRNKNGGIETSEVSFKPLSACSGADAGEVDESHICAGDDSSVAVKGDEGSPITFSDGTLVGLLSNAKPAPAPAIYTRVSAYSTWILFKMINNSDLS